MMAQYKYKATSTVLSPNDMISCLSSKNNTQTSCKIFDTALLMLMTMCRCSIVYDWRTGTSYAGILDISDATNLDQHDP